MSSPSVFTAESPKAAQGFDGHHAERPGEEDNSSGIAAVDDNWTEHTNVTRRRIGSLSVASLAINQMVGSGIFSVPGLVLEFTGSKPLSIGFWVLGGVYTLL